MRRTSERSARVGIQVYKDGEMACLIDGSSHDATEALIYTLALAMYKSRKLGASLMDIATNVAADVLNELKYIQAEELVEAAKRAAEAEATE